MPEQLNFDENAILSRVISYENQLDGYFSDFHSDVRESKNQALGMIYSDADIRKLIKEMRPKFVYNLFIPVLLGLVGSIKNNLPKLDVVPVTSGDVQTAELQQKLLDYYFYNANDIDYELAKSYLFALIGKIGWIAVDYSYEKNPDGMVDIRWVNPLQIKFDPNWSRRDASDMRYLTSYAWMTPEEMVTRYAARDEELAEKIFEESKNLLGYDPSVSKSKVTSWTTRLFGSTKQYSRNKGFDTENYQEEGQWFRDGLFKVIDFYEVLSVPTMRVYDTVTGQSEDITDKVMKDNYVINPATTLKDWYDNDKLQQVRSQFVEPLITTRYRQQRFMYSVVPAIQTVLYANKLKVQTNTFKHIPIFALDIGESALETKSVIDVIRDPVTSYNLRRNTILTYLMKMSNRGWIAEENAIDGYEQQFLNNTIGGLKKVKPGALTRGAIQEEPLPPYPEALSRYSEQDKEDVYSLTPITPNYTGRKESANESGVLFAQRTERADVMQEWLIDNLSASLVNVGRLALATGQRFLRSERVIRIAEEEKEPEYLIINKEAFGTVINDVSLGIYDVSVSKSPSGKFAKEREFEKLINMAQFIIQNYGSQFIDPREILRASNLFSREKLVNHINKIMKEDEMLATMEKIFDFQTQLQNLAQQRLQARQLASELDAGNQDEQIARPLQLAKQKNLLNNFPNIIPQGVNYA